MAKMIPPVVSEDSPSSERRVFEALKSAADSNDWTVLHSLGFSSAHTGQFGEIDFAVIIPLRGIVCIEVKGGRVSEESGVWYTSPRNSNIVERLKRSPFKQAQDGMWKLKQVLEKKFGPGSLETRCPVGWIVILPDIDCPPMTTEFVRGEVIDQHDLVRDISRRIHGAPSLVQLEGRQDLSAPTAATCKRIVNFLRPDFERIALVATDLWDAERRITALTEEQYGVLDSIQENRVCLVKGPAGTGKTNIAIECARRMSAEGMRVLLGCFNRRLGEWLRFTAVSSRPGGVVAGHLHGLLRDCIARTPLSADLPGAEEWQQEDLYGRMYFELGALAIDELNERFDAVLIDEAQDFVPQRLADVVHAWTNGVEYPRVTLFGDFTRQALYGQPSNTQGRLSSAFSGAPVFNLSVNCRNTKRIAKQTDLMCGFAGTRVSEKQIEGDPVEVFYNSDKAAVITRIEQIINALRAAGFTPSQVIILGSRRRENSCLADVRSAGGWRIKDLSTAMANELAYSTIHSFKGLERPVVIVIEVDSANRDEADSLLYVAMSRARFRLFVICPEQSRHAIDRTEGRQCAGSARPHHRQPAP
jgi:Nuclease-related domain/UvrD-like helicase C-terminal domain/AAA domain